MINRHASLSRFIVFSLAVQLLILLPLTNPLSAQTQSSAVPRLIKFSGSVNVHETSRTKVVGLTFALYKDEQGGAPVWVETQNVELDSAGDYTVQLGATLPAGLPQDLFVSGEARWLGVQPAGQPEQRRVLLLSVPYAMKAEDAETLGGLPLSAFVLASPPITRAAATPASQPSSLSPSLSGTGTTNFLPLWTSSTALGSSTLFQSGTGSTARIGIGNTAPAATLDVTGGATVRGLLNLPNAATATAAAGANSRPFGLVASVYNSSTQAATNQVFHWQAEPTGNNTATPSATLNLLFATAPAVAAETGLKINHLGQITFAPGQTFPGAGGTITGVTAGTGLTGGGTTGIVTLNLDTTAVPLLANANIFTTNQTVKANLSANQLISTVAQGTAPLSVTSTTLVPNLNASLLGGFSASAFQPIGSYATLGANTFSGNQTITGNVTASGTVSGGTVNATTVNATTAFNLQGSSFAYGSPTGNLFLGFSTGNTTATGTLNVGVGNGVLSALSTGMGNVAAGWDALAANTTGADNTGIGRLALQSNTSGGSNTAIGWQALLNTTLGGENTAVGSLAMQSNITGNDNTALGVFAGPYSGNTNLNNTTAIGAHAFVTANNSMVLGSIAGLNGATADTFVGIGTPAPTSKLDVRGTANFTGFITFAPGQTFPGAGTITGITAGTGLTGGGSSGGVTLNVDTTKVPQLGTANTFTGNQTMNGNLIATTVGIGTSTPTYPLQVIGMMRSETGLSLGGNATLAVDAPGVIGGHLALLANGNVGINNPNPRTNLDVVGNISASGALIGSILSVGGSGVINGGLTTSAGITTGAGVNVGAGLSVTGNTTLGGSLQIKNDLPMNSEPRMYLTGYMPGPAAGFESYRPIFTVLTKDILITRMTLQANTDPYCSSNPLTFSITNTATNSVIYSLTIPVAQYQLDSGPLSIPISGGTYLGVNFLSPQCNVVGMAPADIAISVEYVMQ